MPRTREQFLEMKDERKASILKAALPLFSLYGQKVSIDQICKNAKCSHGIIYHYFKNTDQIYEKLCNSADFFEIRSNLLDVSEGSSYQKIERIFSELLNVKKDDLCRVSYLNLFLNENGKGSLSALLEKLIKAAQMSGTIVGGEPKEIVNCIFLLLKGIYLPLLTEKRPSVKVPSVEILMQLVRRQASF